VTFARLRPALAPVIAALDRLQIPYHVGGSVASSRHGIARTTVDADVVAALERRHAHPFVAALGADYYADVDMALDAIERRASFNVIFLEGMIKIDIFVAADTPFARSEMSRAVGGRLGDDADALEVRFTSAEDIVLRKLEWYRASNQVFDRQWTDVIAVLQVQAGAIDVPYMRQWAPSLGIADLLEKALAEAGLTSS
jgi:hypothetical protein